MGTALLALSSLFAPIQSWVARHADARRSSGLNATELHYVNVRPRPGREMRHAASSRRDAAERPPLRVLRASAEEIEGHDKVLGEIAKANKGHCLWLPPEPAPAA